MKQSEHFAQELDSIENDDIREFAKVLLDNAPEYILTVAASSSGKYHPSYALGDGGLIRHLKAVVRFLNHILSLEQHSENFTVREMDLMRVAALYHDGEKHGKEGSNHTIFEHPICAAETVRSYKGQYLSDEELEYIAGAISSHMGSWNTSKKSNIVLPKPETLEQRLVHLSDYLASKKDIEVQFENYVKPELPQLNTYELTFGKHVGKTLLAVKESDPTYIDWLKENYGKFPVRELVKQL